METVFTSEDFEAIESQDTINKIEPYTIYDITEVKKIKTKYGMKYILKESNGNTYWALANMIRYLNKQLYLDSLQFTLITLENKEWTSSNNNKYIAPRWAATKGIYTKEQLNHIPYYKEYEKHMKSLKSKPKLKRTESTVDVNDA